MHLDVHINSVFNYISEGSVSHINGIWPNSKHSQLVGSYNLYNVHRKQNAHVQKTALYIPNHAVTLRPFFKLTLLVVHCKLCGVVMDSLSAASQILSQMKEFSEGMTLLRQDVDRLMRASLLQRDQSTNPGSGAADNMTSELVPPAPPPSNSESASAMVLEPPHRIPGTTWAEEMDMISPLVDDETPPGTTPTIQVVPVSERTNKFLNEAFATKLTPVQRKTLRSQYTLPQNELTKNPILDTMLASQCSSTTKSMDRTLSSLQGRVLEAVGPLSQLLEAINDEDPQISMDQIGEAVETALTLLANASLHISEVRRTKVFEEYNKELLPFATAKERDWASGAPRLFGPNFLKEATDYLQQLQLLRKAKEKPVFQQTPLHNQQGGSKGKPWRQPLYSRSTQPRKQPVGKRTFNNKK